MKRKQDFLNLDNLNDEVYEQMICNKLEEVLAAINAKDSECNIRNASVGKLKLIRAKLNSYLEGDRNIGLGFVLITFLLAIMGSMVQPYLMTGIIFMRLFIWTNVFAILVFMGMMMTRMNRSTRRKHYAVELIDILIDLRSP